MDETTRPVVGRAARRRVLVVEDDVAAARALRSHLTDEGYDVLLAQDGEEAIRMMRESAPDIVLTDLGLPRIDGFGVLDELQAEQPQVPVIVMTGAGEIESAVRAMRLGAENYLQKPLDLDVLTFAMARAFERRRLRAEAETFFAISPDMVCVAGFDGSFKRVNAAWTRNLGWTSDELLATPWLELVHPDERSTVLDAVRVLSEGDKITSFETRVRDEGGLYRWVLWDAAGIPGSDDIYAVARDVTERRVAHQDLEKQFRHAQKMEAVGRLAGGVAHDFNNVLSVILSYADLICEDLAADAPMRPDVEEIRKAGLRAADLTRQLLAFSRQQVLQAKVLDLDQCLAGVRSMIGRLLGADIELTVIPGDATWSIKADPGQIEQVVMNLAVNARDAMPEGGRLRIETRNVELDERHASAHHDVVAGPYVLLTVADTGIGMDPQMQDKIFEPFFTTKEKGKGTGLGLATVFGIVKQSGGHIAVRSEPGKGASFEVYFPKARGAPEAHSADLPAPEPVRGTETILLVEDDDQVRALARSILRRSGYVILEAPNGGEALLICEQHPARIHLVLTDVILPWMNGRQLAERLAKLRPDIKVLFMSGYTDDAILQHGVLESGVAFLHKPFTPGSLTQKVQDVLNANRES